MHSESALGMQINAMNFVFPVQHGEDKKTDKSIKGKIASRLASSSTTTSTTTSPRIGSIEELLRSGTGVDTSRTIREEKGGALHKAKKHFKTLMMGSGASSKHRLDKADSATALRQLSTHQTSEDKDSDSESTLVSSASRSTSTLNSASDLDHDTLPTFRSTSGLAFRDREVDRDRRREERKRLIAERQAIRSRANSISDESHSPTCPNPVLCRRFSRDVDAGHAHPGHSHCPPAFNSQQAVSSHLTALRYEFLFEKIYKCNCLTIFFLLGEVVKMGYGA